MNNDGKLGRWGYVEISDINQAQPMLTAAIAALRADAPVIGDPVT